MPTFLPWRWLLLVLLSHLALAAGAQPAPIQFGQIDPKDLTAAPFVADSAAPAVVLADYGTLSFPTGGGEYRFERHTRIKILKKAGFSWATVEVLLRQDPPHFAERLANLRGCTYNLVGGQVEKTPLVPSAHAVLDHKTDDYSLQRVALPQVREGSVIEIAYTLYSNYLVALRTWEFQRSIPVRWSELRAALPPNFTYKMFVQASQPLAVEEQSAPRALLPTFRWAMRNVPALRTEPFMTTPADYVDKVFFELASSGTRAIAATWPQIDELILNDWERGQQLDHTNFLKDGVARLPAPTLANAPQRLAATRALVMAAVRCNGRLGVRTSGSLRQAYLQTHQGTVADVNYLLVAALRAAGYTANPVLLSTRSHGRVRTSLPQISQFNYVAAHVALPDGQELVLDATNPLLPYDMLPERCLNQQGRVVTGQAATTRWVELRPRHRRVHLQQVQLQLDANGDLRGTVHEEFGGYAGAQRRADLLEVGEKKFVVTATSGLGSWTVDAAQVANRDSLAKPLVLEYAVAQPAGTTASAANGALFLSPLQDFGPASNPFRTETRQFPVDFGYAREETLVVNLVLPPGYTADELPRTRTLDLPDNGGRFACNAAPTATGVQLTSRFVLRKPVYGVAEYGQLRALYQALLENQAHQLLIRKKG